MRYFSIFMWAFGGLGSLFAFILLLLVGLKNKTQLEFESYTLLPISAAFLYMAWRKYKSPRPSNKKVKEENKTLIFILAVALITFIIKTYF